MERVKAIIYTRVSSAAQETDGTSLESQATACREYAGQNGYTVEDVVTDVYSGAYLHDRPGLSRLRDAIRLQVCDVVVVYAIDRFSRNLAHLMILVEEFERYNVQLKFVTEALDATPEGKLLQSVKGYVAEVEREKIRERCMRGRKTHAINGTLSFGRQLFGYSIKDNGKRVVCEHNSGTVIDMFEAVLRGDSLRVIATTLNQRGVPTPSGAVWWPQSVKSIINNPAYCGRTVAFRYQHDIRYENGQRIHNSSAKRDESEWIEIPNATPAIVSVDDWEAAQLACSSRNLRKPGRRPTLEFLLRGLVFCAACGRQFSPVSKKTSGDYPRWRAYVCTSTQNPTLNCKTRSFQAREAEETVWQFVRDLLVNREYKQPKPQPTVDELTPLERRRDKLAAELATLARNAAVADETLWPVLEREMLARKADISRLDLERQKILQRRNNHNPTTNLATIRKRVANRLETLTFPERTELLRDLGLRCTWNGKTLHTTIYNYA